MADSIEQFSCELTANALAEQERAVAALRARTGTIMATASIAGSYLATKTGHGSLDGWAIAALITFVLCLASAVWVLLPHSFVFAVRGETLLGETDHLGVRDVAEAYRAAGIWLEPHLERNRAKLSRMSGWFTASCVLLSIGAARRRACGGAGCLREVVARRPWMAGGIGTDESDGALGRCPSVAKLAEDAGVAVLVPHRSRARRSTTPRQPERFGRPRAPLSG